jgi:hypothetical protein
MSAPITLSESARARVRTALAEAVRDLSRWQIMPEMQRRNLLLDAVGSDHRPLVDLLLFAEQRGVADRLPAGPLDGDRWELVHAHAALDFASRTFVQIDAARWVVETWAFATTRISAEQLERRVDDARATRTVAPAAPSPSPSSLSRVPSSPASPRRPSVAGQLLPGAAAAVVHRILPPGPRWRTQSAPTAARHLASRGSTPTVEPAAAAIAVMLLIALPAIAVVTMKPDRTRRYDVVSITAPVAAAPSQTAVPQSVSTANEATPRVAESLAPGDIRARGVAGRYRLTVQGVDVTGSASCDAVQRSIESRKRPIERIEHLPGTDRITIGSSGQLVGYIEADGRFRTDRARGATRGVQWSVQWSGVFDGDSLIAISESETSGVLRWREEQSCRTLTRLVGHRLSSPLVAP